MPCTEDLILFKTLHSHRSFLFEYSVKCFYMQETISILSHQIATFKNNYEQTPFLFLVFLIYDLQRLSSFKSNNS